MSDHKGEQRCPNCFEPLEDATVCPACGFDQDHAEEETGCLPLGTVLMGRYLVGRVLGRGGFGITYLAYDMKEEETCAVKEYFPDTFTYRLPGHTAVSTYSGQEKTEGFQVGCEKFYEEAKTVARFNGHPNIIHIHKFFYENGTAYFSMEYMRGIDLKQYVEQHGGRLPLDEALRLLMPIVDALALVHSVDMLHRDISPDNIYITEDGTPKLLDFGSARQVLTEQSKSLSVILKPGFAPIEQYQTHGKQGPWTDIYALGATLYYCLTGVVPVASMDRVETDTLAAPSSLAEGLGAKVDRVLLKALAVKSVYRYPSMAELRADLAKLLPRSTPGDLPATVAVRGTRVSIPSPADRLRNKRVLIPLCSALVVAVAALIAIPIWLSVRHTPPVREVLDEHQTPGTGLAAQTVKEAVGTDVRTTAAAATSAAAPTEAPSAAPTDKATQARTVRPTAKPTAKPATQKPTAAPTKAAPEPTYVTGRSFVMKTALYTVKCTYTGDWKNGSPNGYGTATIREDTDKWDIGDVLYCSFTNGKADGSGYYKGVSGNEYYGSFKNGLKDGEGVWVSPNGKTEDVVFRAGELVSSKPHDPNDPIRF